MRTPCDRLRPWPPVPRAPFHAPRDVTTKTVACIVQQLVQSPEDPASKLKLMLQSLFLSYRLNVDT